jgi:hypothetical protein
MISNETHTSNWILTLKRKLGKHSDVKIIKFLLKLYGKYTVGLLLRA